MPKKELLICAYEGANGLLPQGNQKYSDDQQALDSQ